MDNPETITILSLCTGYGGLELGLSRALSNPMRVVAVEVEAYAAANLATKAQEGKLAIEAMWPDLKTFPAKEFSGCFDFITAGYPCQPFSTAGKRQGTSDPRHLWPHIAGIVQAVRPVWCFFENVSGHLTIGFPEVYRSLRNMGYKVEAGLFSASEVGAPHKRQRLFILAHCQSIGWGNLRVIRNMGKKKKKKSRARNKSTQTITDSNSTGASEQLADTTQAGLQRQKCTRRSCAKRWQDTIGLFGQCSSLWPSRPGQPQYEWEEPRVVSNSSRLRCNTKGAEQSLQGVGESSNPPMEGQAQSRLGRAANGTSSRVDRLRLLGNGVVPQCAEKAFRMLMKDFE